MQGRKRVLGSAVGLGFSAMYLPDLAAFEQVCGTAAATGVHCCELVNRLVPGLISPS